MAMKGVLVGGAAVVAVLADFAAVRSSGGGAFLVFSNEDGLLFSWAGSSSTEEVLDL